MYRKPDIQDGIRRGQSTIVREIIVLFLCFGPLPDISLNRAEICLVTKSIPTFGKHIVLLKPKLDRRY